MKTLPLRVTAGVFALLLAFGLSACKQPQIVSREAIEEFKQKVSGEYHAVNGAELLIVPVRSRMVADESVYVERTDGRTTLGRLVSLEYNADKKKVLQFALAFATEGQWRNLRENPELFTALLPKDMKPAGTCDIKPAADGNSVSYSCGGSPPETFTRK
jgi:hypothetical protein